MRPAITFLNIQLSNSRDGDEKNKYDLSGGNPGQNLAGRQKM